jgi:hypothetical protein
MNDRQLSDRVAALLVAVLMLLIAFGSGWVLLVASVLALAVGVLLFRKSLRKGGALVATVAILDALVIAVVILVQGGR